MSFEQSDVKSELEAQGVERMNETRTNNHIGHSRNHSIHRHPAQGERFLCYHAALF